LLVHRCLGRQIAAHPLAADRCWRMLARERLKRLWKVALAAPSHARVRIIHRSNSDAYPISSDRPVPDLPAGRFCSKWRSDQSTKGGVEDHQLLCRQAGEGQPRALPHQLRRRGGRSSSTDGRGRASSGQERCLSPDGSVDLEFKASHAEKGIKEGIRVDRQSVRPSYPLPRLDMNQMSWHA